MALKLFAHNEKAYSAMVSVMEKYGKAAIVSPTGTGKSYIAFKLIEDHPETTFLWLSPSGYIYKTQRESLQKQGTDIDFSNVHFYTYAKLMNCTQAQLAEIAAAAPAYIVLDEFHRAGAKCWGESVQKLLALCPQARLLGLTATNVRYLDNNRDMAQELFDGHVAYEMTLGEAIVRGILPAPKYVTTVFGYRQELARYEARVEEQSLPGVQEANRETLDALKRALEKADGMEKIFARHITDTSGRYIVFCSGKEHMEEMMALVPQWFAAADKEPNIYKALSEDPATDKAFAAFKADNSRHLKLLFCVDMLNEGVHVDGISGVILLRPTISPIIYKQQIGRALTAGMAGTPLIIDVVNNFEGLCSISDLQDEMKEAVHRLYANGEGDRVVTERFGVVDQVRDCRVLFEQLQHSLESTWDHYCAEARTYYAEHGDLAVPLRYKTPAGLSLGAWIQTQRLIRKGKRAGSLTEQQIDQLDQIGMIWDDRFDLAWQRASASAAAYYQAHGDLMVPCAYKDADGFALGQWVSACRQKYLDGKLDEEKAARLEEIGMQWNAVSANWEHGYAEAAAYRAVHDDLEVPTKYVSETGMNLGMWITTQKRAYKGRRLTQMQIERLEALGMNWDERNDRRWMRYFHAAEQYYAAHGNLNVPPDYEAGDLPLGRWIARMRYAAKRPEAVRDRLTPKRKAMLESIGMQWEADDPWTYRFDLVRKYQQENNTKKIPSMYKTADGIWLGRWLYLQKKTLKSNPEKLTEGQRKRLEEIV